MICWLLEAEEAAGLNGIHRPRRIGPRGSARLCQILPARGSSQMALTKHLDLADKPRLETAPPGMVYGFFTCRFRFNRHTPQAITHCLATMWKIPLLFSISYKLSFAQILHCQWIARSLGVGEPPFSNPLHFNNLCNTPYRKTLILKSLYNIRGRGGTHLSQWRRANGTDRSLLFPFSLFVPKLRDRFSSVCGCPKMQQTIPRAGRSPRTGGADWRLTL